MVNLGAGMDTRACRMECYREFERGFEVDLQKGSLNESGLFEGSLFTHYAQHHQLYDVFKKEQVKSTQYQKEQGNN